MYYDVLDLSPDHVIKSHAIGRLGTISSFPQNLVDMQYAFWNSGRQYKKLVLQSEKVIAKWDRQQLSKMRQSATEFYDKVCQVLQSVTECYYKLRQVLQSVTVIKKWDVTKDLFVRLAFLTGMQLKSTLA